MIDLPQFDIDKGSKSQSSCILDQLSKICKYSRYKTLNSSGKHTYPYQGEQQQPQSNQKNQERFPYHLCTKMMDYTEHSILKFCYIRGQKEKLAR